MALRNHLIHVDRLIDIQESRVQGLHEEYERDVKILKEEFDRVFI
jgi:dynein regulatory complex subunit 2